jgi:ABC-type sugar transport system ATPase subunit
MNGNNFFQIRELKSASLYNYNIGKRNLDIKRGEIYALVAKNEYEINAFMEAIYELKCSKESKIYFKGKPVYGNSIKRNADIAFIFRQPYLVKYLSVAENFSLTFLPKMKGIWSLNLLKKSEKNTKKTLDELNININPHEIVYKLSIEQQKLISIARAFCNNPEIIIMYDPTEALSSESLNTIYEIIHNFKMNNGSIIFLTLGRSIKSSR